MSQSDLTWPGSQSLSVSRTVIIDALRALASNSSGASAPTTTFAFQFWYDETANALKMRNAANTAWITLFIFDQSAGTWAVSGDLVLPEKIVHAGDPDTYLGFFTDQIRLAVGGTEQIILSPTGGVDVTTVLDMNNNNIDRVGRILGSLATYDATTGSAANVHISTIGNFLRSTSSGRYKTQVETAELSYSQAAVYGVRPVWYRSLSEADNPAWGWWGFIAEEVAEIDPRLVQWGADGQPDGVAYDRFIPHLCAVVEHQRDMIAAQRDMIAALEARIAALEGKG
jgi:hypothetical protein